jgi:hypothetical protein
LATPGDFDSATEIEHGMGIGIWRPSSGIMERLAKISIFAPDRGVTHHRVGTLALHEKENLVIPAKEDAALCEVLQS